MLIAGPCVIESRKHAIFLAREICQICRSLSVPLIFKSSFDKGNRSSHNSYRGPGLDEGLRILEEVKKSFDVLLTTDIHDATQAKPVAEIIDIIQIPAFLCRQGDLLEAAVATGKTINVKKGQFMAPWDMKNTIERVENASVGINSLFPPVIFPRPPGCWALWVASKTTGTPSSFIIGIERISETKLL